MRSTVFFIFNNKSDIQIVGSEMFNLIISFALVNQ